MKNPIEDNRSDKASPLISDIYLPEEINEFVFRALMNTSTDSIYIKDPSGRLNMVNNCVVEELGCLDKSEIIGKTDKEIFGEVFGARTKREEKVLYETGEPIANLVEVRKDTPNSDYWTITTKIPLKNHLGEIIGLIGFTRNIDQIKSTETKLRNLATHDPLTNVYNRNGLSERLNEMIYKTRKLLAILVIDVDNLKRINDHYLHKTGDEFLQWFAWILKSTARGNDIVARVGGDEFVLILENINHVDDVSSFCGNLYRNFNQSIDDRFQALDIGMSIGISIYPTDSKDPEKLIEQADKALYQAKSAGKGKFIFYSN